LQQSPPQYVAPPPDPGLEVLKAQNAQQQGVAIQDRVTSDTARLMTMYGTRVATAGDTNWSPLIGAPAGAPRVGRPPRLAVCRRRGVMAEEAKTGLEKEALDRRRDAKSWKEKFVLDFKECYFFASPSRQRQISSDTQPPNTPMLDQAELQTSVAMLNAQDFVTEAVNTYMPEAQPWCERGRGMFVSEDNFDKVKDQVAKDDG
jgi:hypothetical protein